MCCLRRRVGLVIGELTGGWWDLIKQLKTACSHVVKYSLSSVFLDLKMYHFIYIVIYYSILY